MATKTATVRKANTNPATVVGGAGLAGDLKSFGARTIELTASASADVVDFQLRIPSNARIDASSRLFHDDLATSGSPTLDIGLYAVDGNITSDDDALNDGIAVSAIMTTSTQLGGVPVVKDHANAGKYAWQFVNGVTSDPGGFFDVKAVVRDAATTTTGTVTLDLKAYFD
jgi:hypothetical protein